LSKSVLKKCTPLPPAFLANHAGNFTTGWVDAVNPQPFLDADVWPHRTFLTRTPIVTPESRVIYCLGAAEDITRTSFPTGRDDLKSNGISMKSIEAGCVWQRDVSRKEALRIVQKASKKNRRWSVFSTGGFVFKSAD
jgi:hypothetical protein